MNVTIVYQSHRGKTAAYARAMAMYLWQKGTNVSLCATSDFKKEKLENCDCLLLGCWTSGWFVFHQHPNNIWKDFAQEYLQEQNPSQLILFTTYKFRTGSMFRNMKKRMNLNHVSVLGCLKSKTGFLSPTDMRLLDQITQQNSLKK